MTDQCKNCSLKGDIKKCLASDCFQHENWYAKEQQKRIEELEEIVNAVAHIGIDFGYGKFEIGQDEIDKARLLIEPKSK